MVRFLFDTGARPGFGTCLVLAFFNKACYNAYYAQLNSKFDFLFLVEFHS